MRLAVASKDGRVTRYGRIINRLSERTGKKRDKVIFMYDPVENIIKNVIKII